MDTPPRCSKLSPAARRRRPPTSTGLLERLLRRRVVFVAGKGGTGKSTSAGALALLAARRDKRVLAVDVDAKGDLGAALCSTSVGSQPRLVQPGISCLKLQAEESFQEYLNVYFKVPRLARMTPLARVFDFIATGVPGPRDMLVVGKIAYEQRRRQQNGRPVWDIIVVDSAASGHIVSHLTAARNMLTLVRGGMIRGQVQWIDDMVRDHERSTVVLCALPQEMPIVEGIELDQRLRDEAGIAVDACLLNRMYTDAVSPAQRQLVAAMSDTAHRNAMRERLGGAPETLRQATDIASELHRTGEARRRSLEAGLAIPVIEVPMTVARPGLATSRAIADSLEEAMS
ncbi:MAG: ArsA-related P-loop ATPase [Candidatus Dormibacteria bacterium]